MNKDDKKIKYAFGINAVQLVLCIGVYLLRRYGLWENTVIQIAGLSLELVLWILVSMGMFLSGRVTKSDTMLSYSALSVMPIVILTLLSFGVTFIESISAWTAFSLVGAAVMFWNKPVMLLATIIPVDNVYLIYIFNYCMLLLCSLLGAALGRSVNVRLNRREETSYLPIKEAAELAVGVSSAGDGGDTVVIDKSAIESEITAETANIIGQLTGDEATEETKEPEKAAVDVAEAERAAAEAEAQRITQIRAEEARQAEVAAAKKAEEARQAEEATAKKAEEARQAEVAAKEAAEREAAAKKAEEARQAEEAAAKEAAEREAAAKKAEEARQAEEAAAKEAAKEAPKEAAQPANVPKTEPFNPDKASSKEGQNVFSYRDIRTGQVIKITINKITEADSDDEE